MNPRRSVTLVAGMLLCAACAGGPRPPRPTDPRAFGAEPWTSPRERSHPLVGYALSTREERWVGAEEIAAALVKADLVFLGETHDNADHHRLQAAFLKRLLAGGRRPALAFEMLDTSQDAALAGALSGPAPTADSVAEATRWSRSGWPDFGMYRPIFEAGIEARLRIVAANLPRPVAREAVRKGNEALPPDVRDWLVRAGDPTPGELRSWEAEMKENHCGELPAELLPGLVRAQRARDVQMALRVAGAGAGGAVLITGDGHARSDRGVPAWLRRMAPERSLVSIALIEADGELRWPREFAEPYGTARLPFDYVVFTPRAEREDPCEELRRRGRDRAPGNPERARQP